MDQVYLVCAIVGGAFLVLQIVLQLIGIGDSHFDLDHDPAGVDEASPFFKMLSIKTIVAFLTFFGLTGRACGAADMDSSNTLLAALAAGTVALFIVYYILKGLKSLQSDGALDLERAVGEQAEVYIRIPGEGEGSGKVLLAIQGRRIECRATTSGVDPLPPGRQVQVVRTTGGNSVEVLPLEP